MLSAMTFMLAAKAAGLSTVPMEGFDESRVKKVLGIPAHHIVPVVIPVGYSDTAHLKKSRIPLADMTHYNGW
jgi:nitroreductase